MALLGSLLVGVHLMVSTMNGYYGGWINAHATFYGGGDVSGSMGGALKMEESIVYMWGYLPGASP